MEQQETITIKPADRSGRQRVFLILPGKAYKPIRQIGYIKDRIFNTVRKPENQYFRNLNAVGLNYKLVSQGGAYFDFVKIEFGFQILETSRLFFLEYGSFLHFKNNGLDKQIFLSLDKFGMDKVKEFDKLKVTELKERFNEFEKTVSNIQENLF
jgi:hypothetical protein